MGVFLLSIACGAPDPAPTPVPVAPTTTAPALRPLHTEGPWFVDDGGGVVVLRGYNVSARAKVPPFRVLDHPERDLDALPGLGANVVRLATVWEQVEPERGVRDEEALRALDAVIDRAAELGLYVIVDLHQDGYSRYVAGGCGDGFPAWAHPAGVTLLPPDNGPTCADWAFRMAADPAVHRSYRGFYADEAGIRTAWLAYVRDLAARWSDHPGVLGYDLVNEPWGSEVEELAPLYADAGAVILARDADALLFLEGHLSTNAGFPTALPRPTMPNVVYAPHFYETVVQLTRMSFGPTVVMENAFTTMAWTAREWNVPLFLGEYGIAADARGARDHVAAHLDALDARFASGAQWSWTPAWDPVHLDGWNGEDLSVVDDAGRLRANAVVRPRPVRIAGTPVAFEATDTSAKLVWDVDAARGATELFVPGGARHTFTVEGPVACTEDQAGSRIHCLGRGGGRATLTLAP